LLAQWQDMNPIENLWRKVTLIGENQETSDNQTQVDRVAHRPMCTAASNREVTHDRLVKLSTQFRHDAEKQFY